MIARLGASIRENVERFGVFVRFAAARLLAILSGTSSWARWSRLAPQLFLIGTRSIPVLGLTGATIGAILAIEGYDQFAQLGQEHRLGAVVNISVVKQIGPVLAAVMLAGRVGCALTAELGSMRVTEQIDAMRVMAADPLRVLVAPRVVACILMIPVLTIVSNICGVGGGWLVITRIYDVSDRSYWEATASFIDWFDVANGLVKSLFFGGAIGVISCFKGFHCRAGAQGVGRATTEAFVMSFIAIVLINLVLAKLLNDIGAWRYSPGM